MAEESSTEDKEECGWCKWMKAGGCAAEFTVWLSCVDAVRDAGREDVETCASVMGPLWDCMQTHADYYTPQVEALQSGSAPIVEGSSSDAKPESAEAKGQEEAASPQQPFDIDKVTDKDIEAYLEGLDKEEESRSKK